MLESANTWQEWLAAFELAEVVTLPEGVRTRKPEPTDADRDAAWECYTELRTRITTQALPFRFGDEETALESVSDLFPAARELIRKYGRQAMVFATLSVAILNQVVRPFTAEWHRRTVDDHLRTGDERRWFRRDLSKLQVQLRKFMRMLASLAGDPSGDLEQGEVEGGGQARPSREPLEFGVFTGPLGRNVAAIAEAEGKEIRARRQALGLEVTDPLQDVTGLAISGGGIRSATFALGVVQRLVQANLLCEFDYVSTVSGGGYLAGFLSSYLNDSCNCVGPGAEQLPFRSADAVESAPLRHIRNRSKSLIEADLRSRLRVIAQALYGLALSVVAVSPVVALLALMFFACLRYRPTAGAEPVAPWWALHIWSHPLLLVLVIGWAGGVLFLPVVQRLGRGRAEGHPFKRLEVRWQRACFFGFFGIAALAGVSILLLAYEGYRGLSQLIPPLQVLVLAIFVPFALVASSLLVGWHRWVGRILLAATGVSALVPLLTASMALADWAQTWEAKDTALPWGPGAVALVGITAATTFYAFFILDVNLLSPHGYYRHQLARTYLLRRRGGAGGGVAPVDPQRLRDLQESKKAPYHLINCAVNIPTSTCADLRGRMSDFFLFSKHFCGSSTTGYHSTAAFEALDQHLDLGTVIAVSGAAVSPRMGTGTIRQVSFLLGLLNMRLGYWLPNPSRRPWAGPGAGCLLREMFGAMDENGSYLNVSDGGHIENLGVYELLRRRCKYIVSIDGEADPTMCFASLIQVIRYAWIDLGVRIELNLDDLRLQPNGFTLMHFALGRIHYPDGGEGLFLYIKSALTGNESPYVLDYRTRNPSFPHESTANQLYTEAQFEAYRALGFHTADELFRAEILGQVDPNQVRLARWLLALEAHLLGPNA